MGYGKEFFSPSGRVIDLTPIREQVAKPLDYPWDENADIIIFTPISYDGQENIFTLDQIYVGRRYQGEMRHFLCFDRNLLYNDNHRLISGIFDFVESRFTILFCTTEGDIRSNSFGIDEGTNIIISYANPDKKPIIIDLKEKIRASNLQIDQLTA
ncbi:hypothetical protein HYT18_01455 [Candidatus Microgenomates bacterium]|nr:hypothetical protein [Candidatus Microgenomates bacterium]